MERKIISTRDKSELKKLAIELQKYCHHPNCKFWAVCPEYHKKCKVGLELDTSIAWNIASSLIPQILYMSQYIEHRGKVESIKAYCFVIGSYYSTVARHRTKHTKLTALLRKVNHIMRTTLENVRRVEVARCY